MCLEAVVIVHSCAVRAGFSGDCLLVYAGMHTNLQKYVYAHRSMHMCTGTRIDSNLHILYDQWRTRTTSITAYISSITWALGDLSLSIPFSPPQLLYPFLPAFVSIPPPTPLSLSPTLRQHTVSHYLTLSLVSLV